MKIIRCQECGIDTFAIRLNKKYCEKCAAIVLCKQKSITNKLEKFRKRKAQNLKCFVCGIDITEFKQTKKYCPDCSNFLNSITDKEYCKKYNREHRKERLEWQKKYYQIPENKEKHKIVARESARRKAENKKNQLQKN